MKKTSTNTFINTVLAVVTSCSMLFAQGTTSKIYLSQGYNSSTATSLYDVQSNTNPFTFSPIGNNSHGIVYNALGVNPLDGNLYGLQHGTNNLVLINTSGVASVIGSITGLPVAIYYTGEIDHLGNYYVKSSSYSNIIYNVNILTRTATSISLNSNPGSLIDFCYSVVDGLLYGINNSNGKLVAINPITGSVNTIGSYSSTRQFGAMFASSTGEIYGNQNNGYGFYQFNKQTGARTKVSNSPGASINDGAHDVTKPLSFYADLYTTKTNGAETYTPGEDVVYTIVAGNNGPFGVDGATVSDPAPLGIPASNISYTARTFSGARTSVSGTQTGAINDIVSLPVNARIVYTVTIQVPEDYSTDLINTVTITTPLNIVDEDLSNNSATDTDTHNYLPVELISFQAKLENRTTVLGWQTATEINNAYFEVQRSADGVNFNTMETVEGNGTTVELQSYMAVDAFPLNGYNYYRLKQVDFDGKFEYSNTIAVEFIDEKVTNIFPNPANDVIVTAP